MFGNIYPTKYMEKQLTVTKMNHFKAITCAAGRASKIFIDASFGQHSDL